MQTAARLRQMPFSSPMTYLAALFFIAGNVLLPRLFHFLPLGGPTWLPIYFFTLVGAYRCGWRVGLLAALASPAVNTLLFGMPAVAFMPVVVFKSAVLAMIAGVVAERHPRASVGLLAAIVLSYQAVGTLGQWFITGDLASSFHSLVIGVPGMILQVFAGLAVINHAFRN